MDNTSEFDIRLHRIGMDLWQDGSVANLDTVACKVTELKTQLDVQRTLQETARTLQERQDQALPNQQATRVKHFMKFIFEKSDRWKDKQQRLRDLDCDVIIFCALCYKVKEIYHMPSAQFDFLVKNITDFVRRRNLTHALFRDDVNRVIHGEFEPEDDELLKNFLKRHIELRPRRGIKRSFDESISGAENKTPKLCAAEKQPFNDSQITETIQALSPVPIIQEDPARQPLMTEQLNEPTVSLTGDVYELTAKDLTTVTKSDQIKGRIWLTNTYYINSAPFITIEVSRKLSDQLIEGRLQVM